MGGPPSTPEVTRGTTSLHRRPARRPARRRRCAAHLRDRRRQPEPRGRRRAAGARGRGRHRVGARAARGGRGVRGRRGGRAHGPAGRLRRVVRAGQPAPDQRPVRRQPVPRPGPGHRVAHPQRADRHPVLPGDPPRPAVPRVLGVLRDDLDGRPGAAGHPLGHPPRVRRPRRRGADPARRRRGPRRARGRHRRAHSPAGPAGGARRRRRARARRGDRRRGQGDDLRRGRCARLAHRGAGAGAGAQRAGRSQPARQGGHPGRQPVRRRHVRAARVRRVPVGHGGRRPAAPAGHRLPVRPVPAVRGAHRAGGHRARPGWAGGRATTWSSSATSARPPRRCSPW